MSEAPTTPAEVEVHRSGFFALPSWLRIALIAAGTAVVVLIVAVILRVILQTPFIPYGVTAIDKLVPGACLVEAGDAEKYTVVSCTDPHQQQVIAEVDLDFPGVPYTADSALSVYAHETCDRLLEYKLYLPKDLKKTDYAMSAIRIPTLAQYQAGTTTTLCTVADVKAADLRTDLYRPIPT